MLSFNNDVNDHVYSKSKSVLLRSWLKFQANTHMNPSNLTLKFAYFRYLLIRVKLVDFDFE